MAALSDKEKKLEYAKLTYISSVTGNTYEMEGTLYVDNTVLFSEEYKEGPIEDTYVLSNITYKTTDSAEEKNVVLKEIGIEVGYTVTMKTEEKLETEPSAGVTVSAFDESGEEVEATGNVEDIAEVVEEVAVEADDEATGTADDSITFMNENVKAAGRMGEVRSGNLVIAINAGHDTGSGHNNGASGNGLYEDVLTWQVAQACINELRTYSGVTVLDIRHDLYGCPVGAAGTKDCVYGRVDAANNQGAKVFVDLHFNAGGGSGSETWCFAGDAEAKNVSAAILAQLNALGLYNRGVKENSDYWTCQRSHDYGMSGFIVEHAFVDYSGDAFKLQNPSFVQSLGVADATGIAQAYGLSKGRWETDSNGNRYYYEGNNKVYGEKPINGEWYHFDEKTGIMTTGWYDFPDKRVYYKQSGVMAHGEYNIDNKWYNFNMYDGAMVTGWYSFSNKKVYYQKNGEMTYGEACIDSEWYNFNTYDGAMITGWYDFPDKKVYYKTTGEMVHGEYNIDRKWYCFDLYSGNMVKGWYDFPNKRVYYKETGEMTYGEKAIDNEWYNFDTFDGAMITGWYEFPNKKVYYKPTGEMVHGEKAIDNEWYNFDAIDGAMITGWYEFPNKKVYYKPTGEMVHGEYNIENKWYNFDIFDGSMTTGWYAFPNKKV